MFRLPPPPRFTLPPPPMPPLSILPSHLTCSVIQEDATPHSMFISCFIFFLILIILILLFIYIQFYSRQQTTTNHFPSKPTSTLSSHRSYDTISSGIYLQSIERSPTNPSSMICNHYHRISSLPCSYYDILPS